MNKEDIQFLKDLQKQMQYENEHDYDSQASPRFWTIGDYKKVGCPDGFQDEDHVHLPNRDYSGEINELLKQIEEEELDDLSEEALEEFKEISCELSAVDWIKEHYDEDADLIPVREEHIIHPNTMFLTKEEAKRHLKLNHYHYTSKAHTYAMTAWRAPKVERLLKIISTANWDEVENPELLEVSE